MFDPELLQLIRQEIALFSGQVDLRANLHFVDEAMLRAHIERLFYGGEIEARCSLGASGLDLDIHGLTAIGLRRMRNYGQQDLRD